MCIWILPNYDNSHTLERAQVECLEDIFVAGQIFLQTQGFFRSFEYPLDLPTLLFFHASHLEVHQADPYRISPARSNVTPVSKIVTHQCSFSNSSAQLSFLGDDGKKELRIRKNPLLL
jgi:hypothetical protein